MFYQMLFPVFQAVGSVVNWVSRIWFRLGLDWLSWLAGFAALSLLLQFVRSFRGDAIDMRAREELFRRPDSSDGERPYSKAPRRLNEGGSRYLIGDGTYRRK